MATACQRPYFQPRSWCLALTLMPTSSRTKPAPAPVAAPKAKAHKTAPAPQPGMGALPHAGGTTFRVWAPHADAVAVVGTFNGWNAEANLLRPEENADGVRLLIVA